MGAAWSPASSLEKPFIDYLYEHQLRLPDRAQDRPEPDLPVQPDFYYERDGLPGDAVASRLGVAWSLTADEQADPVDLLVRLSEEMLEG